MHRVCIARFRSCLAGLHHAQKRGVVGDFVNDLEIVTSGAAVGSDRVGRKTSPKHHAVALRVSGGDAEYEGIAFEARCSCGFLIARRGEIAKTQPLESGARPSGSEQGRGDEFATIRHEVQV